MQLIGRLARKSGPQAKAYLVASKNQARGILTQLYRNNADWAKLIPKLTQEAIRQQPDAIAVMSSNLYGATELDMHTLTPFFSVTVFDKKDRIADLSHKPDFRDGGVNVAGMYVSSDHSLHAFLLEAEETPRWARDSNLVEFRLELTLFYQTGGYIFEASTSERFGNDLRAWMFGDNLRQPTPEIIAKATGAGASAYYTIGLRSAVANSNAQPSYKMLMGLQAENSIRNTDQISFTSGHAIMRVGDEVRGLALDSKRVWAMKRGSLDDLTAWCDNIASNMNGRVTADTLPGTGIVNPRSAPRIEQRPIAVVLDMVLLHAAASIFVTGEDGESTEASIQPYVRIISFDEAAKVLHCGFVVDATPDAIPMHMSADRTWTVSGKRTIRIQFESPGKVFDGSLEEFLLAYPPNIVIATGIVRGDQWYSVGQRTAPNLRKEMTPDINWANCDITVERSNPSKGIAPKRGLQTVQDHVAAILKERYPNGIIVLDDGTGEIADYIIIDEETATIGFYHCKASEKESPGARVGDIYEVFGQACKSTMWVRYSGLIKYINDHITRRGSPVLQGSIGKGLVSRYQINQWAYKIVVVQPGLSVKKVLASEKLAPLVSSLCDYVQPSNADLEIWASE